MKDQNKSKAQLIDELEILRRDVKILKKSKLNRGEPAQPATLNLLEDLQNEVEERRKAEERLRVNEKRFHELASQLPGAIFQLKADPERKFSMVYLSEGAEALFGKPMTELTDPSKMFSDIHPDDFEPVISSVKESMNQLTPWEMEYRVLWPQNDSVHWIHGRSNPHREPDESIVWDGLLLDITKQKKAETERAQQQDSEEKYRALYNNAPLSYQSLDENGRFLDVNPAWLRTLGYSRDEVIGVWFGDFLHPDYKPHFEKNFPAFKKRGYVHNIQFRIRHKDGHYLYISFEGCAAYHPDGRFKQTYCVFMDITERRQAEELLEQSEKRFRTYINSSPTSVFFFDSNGKYQFVNPAACQLLGYTENELIHMSVADIRHPDEIMSVRQSLSELGEKGEVNLTLQLKHKNQSSVPVILQAVRLSEDQFIGFCTDITELKKAEQELEAHQQDLKDLSVRLIRAQEEERRRLSHELHDEMGQALTGIKLNVGILRNRLGDQVHSEIAGRLVETDALVDGLMNEMHDIALDLRPNMLDDLGLVPTLRWYLKETAKRWPFDVETHIETLDERLSQETEVAFYRIVQECLNNTSKHAEAKQVRIELRKVKSKTRLTVHDDGKGFLNEPVKNKKARSQGIGLLGMKERVAGIGGKFEILTKPGKGTTVKVEA